MARGKLLLKAVFFVNTARFPFVVDTNLFFPAQRSKFDRYFIFNVFLLRKPEHICFGSKQEQF